MGRARGERVDQLLFEQVPVGAPAQVVGEARWDGSAWVFKDSIGTFDPRTGGTPNVFGTEYEQDEETVPNTTSSSIYQSFQSFTSASKPVGLYIIQASFALTASNNNTEVAARFLIDGVPGVLEVIQAPRVENASILISGFKEVTLGAPATVSLDAQFHKNAGTGTVTAVRNSFMIWRVA